MSIKLPLRANAKAGFDTGDKVATDADGAASVRLQDVLSLANSTPELEREIERLRGLLEWAIAEERRYPGSVILEELEKKPTTLKPSAG